MLRFFRHIRKQLMEEKKVRTYLLYAVGEILLVVIGILVALQVNNWNEERKSRALEINLLSDAKIALEDDIKYFNMLVSRMERSQKSALLLAEIYEEQGSSSHDSVMHHINELSLGYLFVYNDGPYEAIKSAGLDIISNREIRSQLTFLYDFYLPRIDLALNDFTMLDTNIFNLMRSFIKEEPSVNELGELEYIASFRSEDFMQTEEFLTFFDEAEFTSLQAKGRLTNALPYLERLLKNINEELNQN